MPPSSRATRLPHVPRAFAGTGGIRGQLEKVTCGLAELERRAGELAGRIDVGTIAIGCALGYLDFRYASISWRDRHPATAAWYAEWAQRESMATTRPPA